MSAPEDDEKRLSISVRRIAAAPLPPRPKPAALSLAAMETYERAFGLAPPAPPRVLPNTPQPRDGHYKAIRQSHRGKPLPAWTRAELLKLRKQESLLQREFADRIKAAKAEGRCTAFAMPRSSYSTPYKDVEAVEGCICDAPAVERGYCGRHFLSHVLYIRDRQSLRAGRGITRRPFRADEIAIGRMSEKQKDLMHDLERLPMDTLLEECLRRLNEADPENPLPILTRKRRG